MSDRIKQPILLDDVQRLRVLPGDVLVVSLDGPVSNEESQYIMDTTYAQLGVKVMVLGDGATVKVISDPNNV